jgi:uncharacterized protein with NRDE domain
MYIWCNITNCKFDDRLDWTSIKSQYSDYNYVLSTVSHKDFLPRKRGTTSQRPTGYVNVGDSYFDTTLGKMIWWNGTSWVDSTGATV